jgi:inosine-uridine nucleoside N-ribohydrolase
VAALDARAGREPPPGAPPLLLLDCDPGHDDALAIALAARWCRLLGITTVAGNVPLARTTANALTMCEVLGLDVPVHAGSSRPLVAELRTAEYIHGPSGLDGPTSPAHGREVASHDAVGFIVDTVRARPGEVWLVATGPLTNVALALRTAPDLVDLLGGVSIMGGGIPWGNTTAAAEFNILVDPEAADVVFRAGLPLTMAGLNATHQWMVDEGLVARLRAAGGRVARFCAELLDYYGGAHAREGSGRFEGPLHDPLAVLAVTHPALVETTAYHVVVELTGTHTRGMTLADLRDRARPAPANVQAITRVDAAAASELLIETLGAYG